MRVDAPTSFQSMVRPAATSRASVDPQISWPPMWPTIVFSSTRYRPGRWLSQAFISRSRRTRSRFSCIAVPTYGSHAVLGSCSHCASFAARQWSQSVPISEGPMIFWWFRGLLAIASSTSVRSSRNATSGAVPVCRYASRYSVASADMAVMTRPASAR
ncbi:hypothetical protein [Luteimicrobium album]|uniref:hypothetical protein n=1 Tax=Luteimicrobium album TaxID=1054550 RepID=UPI0024E0DB13|nr:hypothetical protein [Luteimicrobium album]